MNTLYNNYVSESAIEEAASFEKMSLNIDRLLLAYESVCRKEELDIREAEIRCMEESGDIDLLESYYMEASEENKEKKEGILKRIWNAIAEFFRKIKDFLFGEKQMKNLENAAKEGKEAEVPEETKTLFAKIKEGAKSLLSAIQGLGQKANEKISDMSTLEKIGGIASLVTLAGAITAAIVVKDKNSGQRLIKVKVSEALDVIKNHAQPAIDAVEKKMKEFANSKFGQWASSVVTGIKGKFQEIGNALKKGVQHIKSLFGFASNEEENAEGEGTPEKKDDGNPNRRSDDLEGDEKREFKKKLEALNKKYKGKITKAYRKEKQELLNEYGLVKEYVDEDIEDDIFEESVDFDDYDLPDDFIEESVCDSEINEIAALLDTI